MAIGTPIPAPAPRAILPNGSFPMPGLLAPLRAVGPLSCGMDSSVAGAVPPLRVGMVPGPAYSTPPVRRAVSAPLEPRAPLARMMFLAAELRAPVRYPLRPVSRSFCCWMKPFMPPGPAGGAPGTPGAPGVGGVPPGACPVNLGPISVDLRARAVVVTGVLAVAAAPVPAVPALIVLAKVWASRRLRPVCSMRPAWARPLLHPERSPLRPSPIPDQKPGAALAARPPVRRAFRAARPYWMPASFSRSPSSCACAAIFSISSM